MLKNFAKRIIPIVLAALMVIAMLPAQVLAQAADICDHVIVIDATVPATCTSTGLSEGSHCSVCGEVIKAQTVLEKLPHSLVQNDGKKPTYTESGWEPYETCDKCDYSTFVSLPALGEAQIDNFDEFIANLGLLEDLANMYVGSNPGKDPAALVIKYIRTGVDRYNSGSWGIMAGYEDAGFAKFVRDMEDQINAGLDESEMLKITGLKNINNFELPNGDYVDIGHVFGSMDITYHNKSSINHADVSGWAGDLVDLLEVSDIMGVKGDLDAMIKNVADNLLGNTVDVQGAPSFSQTDIYGDLDAYYIMQTLYNTEYEAGSIATILAEYFTEDLNDEQRAEYFLKNRLQTTGTRLHIRNAVYNAYIGNSMVATLEGTREFKSSDISDLRKAVCYAFADYLCKLAGDYVEVHTNEYFEVFDSAISTLAPGITQESYRATSADGKQMVYYLATADLSRDDVNVYANYNNNDPTTWAMSRVLDQANAAQAKYGNPESEHYIPNYNVVVSTNADGYNMATGEPGGLLIMNGTEYHPINSTGFFGITKDRKAIIGSKDDYNNIYKGQLKDAVGGFGTLLIKDGKIAISRSDNYYVNRAPRTAVGITRTGKVVLMVLDGRQEPYSCGGSVEEIAQIMFEAGCVHAINLDGGGSTTFVAKPEGEQELQVLNLPSDGAARSVSDSLMFVSTAPSSTAFDHAKLESDYDYTTIGTQVKITPVGISATGDIAELPEGYTWAVADTRWGSITEDGVFTGLRNGSVDVYLMLGDSVIGSKTMNIVVPDNIYFSRTNIDAVYGSSVKLPVVALYEGKQVAISASDVVFSLNNAAAGSVSGFDFIASDNANIKVAKVTTALANDESIASTITINLYKQGENTFDFDKATGGDRLLAFDRVISNSTTVDNTTYYVKNTDEDMVTSYTFAMDLTQIPIPERLADLVYMLPGADMENASAWNFLLQLAERISVLTEVTPVLRFDPNVKVDYSGLKIMNEYFSLTSTSFDEATNTLTLKLNWIDQTKAIDPATANPLCLVSGIKLTPKENAAWDANKRISVLHSGQISYNVFMRASALYSFAQKPENQEIYGLMPFVNPNLPSEAGASFGDVYKEFEDTYILINALKNGWVNEDGGFAYYQQGTKYYNVREVDGYYYDFGSKGINKGKIKYTGIFRDDEHGVYRYAKNGEPITGWQEINGSWHYFDKTTKAAVVGKHKIGGINYEFMGDGKLVSGVWANVFVGYRYYYGPSYYVSNWQNIDGEWYYFREGLRVTGKSEVASMDNIILRKWYDFGTDGKSKGLITGIVTKNDELYYCKAGVITEIGLFKLDGDYYYAGERGKLITDQTYYAWLIDSSSDLPKGHYQFGADGKMVINKDGAAIIEQDGKLYYYENGKPTEKGLFVFEGEYYFSNYDGSLVVNESYYAWKLDSTSKLPKDHYEFGADGKMLRGIIEQNGKLYYYENGKRTEKGLFVFEDEYYFSNYDGSLVVNENYYAWKLDSSSDLPKGHYWFGADGKMLRGIIEKNGKLYYYENGQPTEKGLFIYNGDYYFSHYDGSLVVSETYYAWKLDGTSQLGKGHYEFGADGKMLRGIIKQNGKLYYYENGKRTEKGLFVFDGEYYFSHYDGSLVVSETYYAWKLDSTSQLPKGHYEFGADGKMINGIVERDGKLYYYENGKRTEKGLFVYNGDYYFSHYDGSLVVNETYYAWKLDSTSQLPKGHYEFGADGKMLNGIIEQNGKLYYYENGKRTEKGLFVFDGEYYFSNYDGSLVVNENYYVWKLDSTSQLDKGHYWFGADGKMLNGIVERSGKLYYYENGQSIGEGLVYIDGYYYYSLYNGELVTNQTYYVWKGNNLLFEKHYMFNELGQIIG